MKKKDHDKIVDDLQRENQGHLRTNTKYYKDMIVQLKKDHSEALKKVKAPKLRKNLHDKCKDTETDLNYSITERNETIKKQKSKLDTYYVKVKYLEDGKTVLKDSVSMRLDEIDEFSIELREKNSRIDELEAGIIGLIIKLK